MDPAALYAGIGSTTAQSLLASHLRTVLPARATFLSELDALLAASAHLPALYRGDTIELQGVTNSGKTSLLHFLAMTTLLPDEYSFPITVDGVVKGTRAVKFGGMRQRVVWMDCTQGFDVRRLEGMLRSHVTNTLLESHLPLDEQVLTQIIDTSLSRFSLYSPTTSLQLAAALHALPTTLAESRASEDLGYLLIDGYSDFVWPDAHLRESSPTLPATIQRHILTGLARIREEWAPILVLTEHVLRDHKLSHLSSEGDPFYSHHRSYPWPSIATPSTPVDPLYPLRPVQITHGGVTSQSIGLTAHITLHPPPLLMISPKLGMMNALRSRSWHHRKGEGPGERFSGVVRGRGGKEVGSWLFDITTTGIE